MTFAFEGRKADLFSISCFIILGPTRLYLTKIGTVIPFFGDSLNSSEALLYLKEKLDEIPIQNIRLLVLFKCFPEGIIFARVVEVVILLDVSILSDVSTLALRLCPFQLRQKHTPRYVWFRLQRAL